MFTGCPWQHTLSLLVIATWLLVKFCWLLEDMLYSTKKIMCNEIIILTLECLYLLFIMQIDLVYLSVSVTMQQPFITLVSIIQFQYKSVATTWQESPLSSLQKPLNCPYSLPWGFSGVTSDFFSLNLCSQKAKVSSATFYWSRQVKNLGQIEGSGETAWNGRWCVGIGEISGYILHIVVHLF